MGATASGPPNLNAATAEGKRKAFRHNEDEKVSGEAPFTQHKHVLKSRSKLPVVALVGGNRLRRLRMNPTSSLLSASSSSLCAAYHAIRQTFLVRCLVHQSCRVETIAIHLLKIGPGFLGCCEMGASIHPYSYCDKRWSVCACTLVTKRSGQIVERNRPA
jgi:hypothetical protein